jgi:hypothetical protein
VKNRGMVDLQRPNRTIPSNASISFDHMDNLLGCVHVYVGMEYVCLEKRVRPTCGLVSL